jgi:putative glutathione S-transferase
MKLAVYIYDRVSNGVYKTGFATTQESYEKPCRELFAALDTLEAHLASHRYLFGTGIVEVDSQPSWLLMDLYQHPGIGATVDYDHSKRHYYSTHNDINPTRSVLTGTALDLTKAHNRDRAFPAVSTTSKPPNGPPKTGD